MPSKVLIIDNAAGGVAYDKRWDSVYLDLIGGDIDASGIIPGVKVKDFEYAKFQILSALSKNLSWYLKDEIDDDTIIIFPDARSTLAIDLHEYRVTSGKEFKMLGFWTDGIYHDSGTTRKRLRGTNYNWSQKFERCLVECYDYNLVFLESSLDKFKHYHVKKSGNEVLQCSLPFTAAINAVREEAAEFNEVKEDLVIMNTSPHDYHDLKIFTALQKEFPEYTFVNAYEKDLPHKSYVKLLSRAKVVLSTCNTDSNPYSVLEAMSLGCIPVLPDIPIYQEMFDSKWLYDKVILKLPYLNYIRNRDQIHTRIKDAVENYSDYNLTDEVEKIHMKYFDSQQLKDIISNIT